MQIFLLSFNNLQKQRCIQNTTNVEHFNCLMPVQEINFSNKHKKFFVWKIVFPGKFFFFGEFEFIFREL